MKQAYYAIIPANVRYDKTITANAKLLYGEITALCNQKGYCWASNQYFSELYGVSKKTISTWISSLVAANHIKSTLEYKKGSREIVGRYLQICNGGMEENVNTPMEENVKDNTTKINNTINNTIERGKRKTSPAIDYHKIVNLYQTSCSKLPKVTKLTDKRKRAIKAVLKERSEDELKKILETANRSSFLTGENNRGWRADFDWIFRDDHLTSIDEGKYNGSGKKQPPDRSRTVSQGFRIE